MNQKQLLFLHRTIHLAQTGFRKSSVKPLIGWVVVHHDRILAEGWLDPNVSYLAQFKTYFSPIPFQADTLLYISTNPFATHEAFHHVIRRYKIEKAVIAEEVNPALCALVWYVNRRQRIYHYKKRPYIILKWAQTADGFIARTNSDSKWISGTHARTLVHQWRAQEASIWVGKNTYRHDNPQLNVRNWVGEDPVRIVVDPQGSLPQELNVFDQRQSTLYYSMKSPTKSRVKPPASLFRLEFVALPGEFRWEALIPYVLSDLYQRQISSVFVEGGAQLLSFLIQHRHWDEARVFTSDKTFGEGIAAPCIEEKYLVSQETVSEDRLSTYYRFPSETEEEVEKEE